MHRVGPVLIPLPGVALCWHIPFPPPVTSLSCLSFPPSETSRGDEEQPEAQATHASSVPTHTPTWEEEVTVEMDAEDAGWAGESIRGPQGLGRGSHFLKGSILGY